MTCAACRANVERAVAGDGVLEHYVSLLTRAVVARYDPAATDAIAISDRIRAIGYEVEFAEAQITLGPADGDLRPAALAALGGLDGLLRAEIRGDHIWCQYFADYVGRGQINAALEAVGITPLAVRTETAGKVHFPDSGPIAARAWWNRLMDRLEDLTDALPDWSGPADCS